MERTEIGHQKSEVNKPPALGSLLLALCFSGVLLFTLCSFAEAQQSGKVFRIAVLAYDQQRANMESFFEELQRLGYVANQNAIFELWNAEGRAGNLPKLSEEVGRFKPDVVLASATPAALAAQKTLPITPIVFTLVADPLGAGLVASFANPGGNLTGLTNLNVELSGKRAELMMETFPAARRIGVLTNPTDPISAPQLKEVARAAQARRVKLDVFNAREPKDLKPLPAVLMENRLDGMTLISSQLFAGHRTELVSIATATKTPMIYWSGAFVEAGGLISYGVNVPELYRRAAIYVDKILKGAKPANLPVEQPAKFELIINLKAAKQIGLTIPPNMLARADKVIK
jgi:putative ABC transport system substrate-binding protein